MNQSLPLRWFSLQICWGFSDQFSSQANNNILFHSLSVLVQSRSSNQYITTITGEEIQCYDFCILYFSIRIKFGIICVFTIKTFTFFFNNPSLQDLIFWFCELVCVICLNVFQVFHRRNKVTKKFNTNPPGGHHSRWLSKECFNLFIACLRVKNFENTLILIYIWGRSIKQT